MAKAAMASLFVDPTTRFVNSLITSEIEVSDSLLSRIWPGCPADLHGDEDLEFSAGGDDDSEYEIEFEADEDEDGFLANLLQWSPRRRKG